jgi:glycosyltransferase involved in cell wall biosynthesis
MLCPYYPPHIGGVETYAEELGHQLTRRGWHLTVLAPRLPRSASPHTQAGTTRILRFPAAEPVPTFPVPALWRPAFWRLLAEALQPPPDLVISHTRFFPTSFLAGTVAWRLRRPWLHIEHGSSFVNVTSRATSLLARLYDLTAGRFVLTRATIVVSISEAVQQFVRTLSGRTTPVVRRGLDVAHIDRTPARIPGGTPDTAGKVVLVTVGRLSQWKGMDMTIQAVLALPPEIQQSLLYLIVGDGEEKSRLTALARPPIIFLGARSSEETIGILKSADIYLHGSRAGGGLSTALLEALVCNCAVVATPYEGARELLVHERTGFLVPTHNATVFSRAVLRLMNAPNERQTLAAAGRAMVLPLVRWEDRIQELERILHARGAL